MPDPVEAPTAAGSGLEPKETSQNSQVGDPEPRVGKSCWGNCPPIPPSIHPSTTYVSIYQSVCLSITYQYLCLLPVSHPPIHPSVIHPSIHKPTFIQQFIIHLSIHQSPTHHPSSIHMCTVPLTALGTGTQKRKLCAASRAPKLGRRDEQPNKQWVLWS